MRRWSSITSLHCICAAGLVLGCSGEPAPPEPSRPPNVLLLVVDTLRADALRAYGFDGAVSPNLDRLASEGVLFERALAQSTWTKVSMASLMTSLWPEQHAVHGPTDALAEEAFTIQDALRAAGFATYGVQSNGWLEQSFGFHHGFDRYLFPHATTLARELGRPSVWPHGARILEEAERILAAHAAARPFFLYVHLMDVHEYAAPPEYRRFGASQRDAYSAAILWVDDLIGRLRVALERHGFADDTLIVFASDHGEAFGENRTYGHARNVHTPVLHVPLVLHMPGRVPATRVSAQVRNLDIAPTILDLVGLPAAATFEGESLRPLFAGGHGGGQGGGDRVSYAGLGAPIMRGVTEQVAVNDGVYSLVRTLGERPDEMLFDQELDGREDADILDYEPDEAARLRALLDAHRARPPAEGAAKPDVRIDPGIANRLRALGYLQ